MDTETFKLLQQADWATIGRALLAFARWRASNYAWRQGYDDGLGLGETCEDIVQEVILKTINGDRHWDPSKGKLLPWLRDQVRSEIDHHFYQSANQHEIPFPQNEDQEDESVEQIIPFNDSLHASIPKPEQAILDKEKRGIIKQRVDSLYDAIDGIPVLEEIFEAILDGCEPKPRELAKQLGIPVQDVNNRLKRIRRRARKGAK